ncbi:MAG: hypothetical protein J1E16_01530 [Muribaculaceae bacterium]|nr:hypothetical protein [Muribaculaceae bacterium]
MRLYFMAYLSIQHNAITLFNPFLGNKITLFNPFTQQFLTLFNPMDATLLP